MNVISTNHGTQTCSCPDVSEAYQETLTPKTRELLALSLAVVTDCRSCIESHILPAADSGATLGEVLEAIDIAARNCEVSATDTAVFARDAARRLFEKRPVRASILAKTRW